MLNIHHFVHNIVNQRPCKDITKEIISNKRVMKDKDVNKFSYDIVDVPIEEPKTEINVLTTSVSPVSSVEITN